MVGIPLVHPEALRVFAIEGAAIAVLVAIQAVVPFGPWTIVAAGLVSLAVLVLCRDALRVDELFPEVSAIFARLSGLVARRRAD